MPMTDTSKLRILGLALVAVLYVAMRLWGLGESCLWFDEIFGVHAAGHGWSEMLEFVALDLIHPPLFYILLKLWIAIGGESTVWLRLFPVIWSVLAIVSFVGICRELGLKYSAQIVALALVAVNGSLIKYAQEVRMYSMLMCLSLASIWLFLRVQGRDSGVAMLIAVNIALVYTHYFGWLVVAAGVIVLLAAGRESLKKAALIAFSTLVALVPWLVAVFNAASSGSDIGQNIGWLSRPGIRQMVTFVFNLIEPFYYQTSSDQPISRFVIAVPFLLLLLTAAIVFAIDRIREPKISKNLLTLGTFVIVPIAIAFTASWLLPYSFWGTRHLIIVFVPFLLFVGIALTEVTSTVFRAAVVSIAGVLVSAAFVFQTVEPKPNYPWCLWEASARHLSGPVYAFEDLAAYHLWFATKSSSNYQISKVSGTGVREDTAYFLPRGFDVVQKIAVSEINAPRFSFVFRDSVWNESHPPIAELKQRGYAVKQIGETEPAGGVRVFIGEAERVTP